MRVVILIGGLVVAALAAEPSAEPGIVPPREHRVVAGVAVPADEPPLPVLGEEEGGASRRSRTTPVRPFALAVVRFGSSARVGHGIERRREGGDVVDGTMTLGVRRERHRLAIAVGTDHLASASDEVAGSLSYAHADYRDLVAVRDLALAAGWSSERRWVVDGDLLLGPLHLAAGGEDGVRSYHLGGGLGVLLPRALLRFTCDRVIIYPDEAPRALATATALQVGVRPGGRVLVQLSGGYTHDALTGDGVDGVWEGALAFGLVF